MGWAANLIFIWALFQRFWALFWVIFGRFFAVIWALFLVVIWVLFGLLSGRFLGYYLGAFWVISGRFLALFLALFGLLFGRFLDAFPGAFWALFCVQIGQVYSTPPCPSSSGALLGQPVGLNTYSMYTYAVVHHYVHSHKIGQGKQPKKANPGQGPPGGDHCRVPSMAPSGSIPASNISFERCLKGLSNAYFCRRNYGELVEIWTIAFSPKMAILFP